MNLQIDEHIFRWFHSLELCKTTDGKKLRNSKIELTSAISSSIETGPFIVSLLQSLMKKYLNPISPLPNALNVSNFKQVASPSSRFYNWNLIGESLKILGFVFDKEMINIIVLGDLPMINEFLKDLYNFYKNSAKFIHNSSSVESVELCKSMAINDLSKVIKALPPKTKEAIELLGLQATKSLRETDSLIEFFVLDLAQSLNLKPNQAATLLTKNTKYLSHVLAKGSKGEFEPIVTFFQGFVENKQVILNFLQSEDSKNGLNFFFQAIKAGLVSKDVEVSLWTLKTYEIFIDILDSNEIYEIVWKWLVENFGMKNLFLCLKRHPELQNLILKVLIAFGKKRLFELLNERLKEVFSDNKELFFVLSRILQDLSENPLTKTEISKCGALLNWIDISLENLSISFIPESIATRIQALSLLTEIWRLYPKDFQDKTNCFLTTMKTNFAYKSKLLQNFIIIELFNFLTSLLHINGNQHPTVIVLYNLLIGFLIENFSETELRTFLIEHFIEAFNSKNIALSKLPLMESLNIHLMTLDSKSFHWNLCDFNLMINLAENENIPIKSALLFLDLQGKIFINNQVFSQISAKPFLLIFSNNKSVEALQEFCFKFAKTCLSLFLNLHRKPSIKEKKQKIIISKKAIPEYSDLDLKKLKVHKKTLILYIIKEILFISVDPLKNKLKLLICQTIFQMKKYISKKPNKPLMTLLETFAENAEKIMNDYEADHYQRISQMRDEEKKKNEKKQEKALEIDNISRISAESSKDLTNALTLSLDLSNMGFGSTVSKNSSFQRKMSLPLLDTSVLANGGKSQLSKAEELKMNLLRNPKIDPKLRKKLLLIEEERKEKLKSLDQTMKQTEVKLQVRKVKLRKQVEQRNKEIGVGALNIKDYETNLLFPLDSLLLKESVKENDIEIINFELLEEYEMKMIEQIILKKKKILNKVFLKFSNLKVRYSKPDTFEKISLAKHSLSLAELWTMIKELENKEIEQKEIFARISQEGLMKAMKIIVKKETSFEEFVMDNDQFEKILISMAKFLYSNEEIHEGLQKLIGKLADLINCKKNDSQEKNEKQEPQIKYNEDPNFTPQEGFIKVKEVQTLMKKELPISMQKSSIPESFLIVYEIMDEILEKKWGIELIEKLSKENVKYYAKKDKVKVDISNKSVVDKTERNQQKEKEMQKDEIKKKKKRIKSQVISKQQIQEYKDKAEIERKNKEEEERKIMEIKKSEEKVKRDEEKKKLEELQKNRLLFEQKMKDVWHLKHRQNLEIKNNFQEKKMELLPEETARREKIQKEFKIFNKKKIEQFHENFQSLISKRKKNQEEYITKSSVFSKKLKVFNDRILPAKLKEMKEKEFETHENHELIAQNLRNPEIEHFFKFHELTLQSLFNFLLDQTYTPLNLNNSRRTVPLQTLINFTNEFNICPMFFKVKHIMNFYKVINKKKPYVIDQVEVGLDYEEFLECFFRIAIKGNEALNKMCEFLIMGGHLKENNHGQEVKEGDKEKKQEENTQKNKKFREKRIKTNEIIDRNKNVLNEKYNNVTLTTENTLIALLFYMGFPLDPKDKETTLQRLRDIITQRKIKPTKYRFLELQKKLEGEGYDNLQHKKKKKKLRHAEKINKTENAGNEKHLQTVNAENSENEEYDEFTKSQENLEENK